MNIQKQARQIAVRYLNTNVINYGQKILSPTDLTLMSFDKKPNVHKYMYEWNGNRCLVNYIVYIDSWAMRYFGESKVNLDDYIFDDDGFLKTDNLNEQIKMTELGNRDYYNS